MGRTVRNSRGKTMKPNFFVFCEGKTEINYVKFLRSVFRVPIQVIAKKSDSNISLDFIERSIRPRCGRDVGAPSKDSSSHFVGLQSLRRIVVSSAFPRHWQRNHFRWLSSYVENPFSAIWKRSIDRIGETNPCWKHGESHRKGKEVGGIQESFVFGLSVDWGDGEGVASCTSQSKLSFISSNRLRQPCLANVFTELIVRSIHWLNGCCLL